MNVSCSSLGQPASYVKLAPCTLRAAFALRVATISDVSGLLRRHGIAVDCVELHGSSLDCIPLQNNPCQSKGYVYVLHESVLLFSGLRCILCEERAARAARRARRVFNTYGQN